MYHVKVISDIHLENKDDVIFEDYFDTSEKIDIICLCGDIGNPKQESYIQFLKSCAEFCVIQTLVLMGNHEAYGKSIEETEGLIKNICASIDPTKITFLNNSTYDLGEFRFLGTTLWSELDTRYCYEIRSSISDFWCIKDWNIGKWRDMYFDNVVWLRLHSEEARQENKQVIIMSHHAPLQYVGNSKYADSQLKSAFCSDMHDFIKNRKDVIRYWFYGHDHHSMQSEVDGVIVLSNQVGYGEHEKSLYNKHLTIYLGEPKN